MGLPEFELRKLQVIQNSAARLLTRTKKSEHITPVLKCLHLLPVHERLEFKVLCLVYKVIQGVAPAYICELLHVKTSSRSLRSTSSGVVCLKQPLSKTNYYGSRSFSVHAPLLWNALPKALRAAGSFNLFKTSLKTHLFKRYFQ